MNSVWHVEKPFGLSNSMNIYPIYIMCPPDAVKTKAKIRPQHLPSKSLALAGKTPYIEEHCHKVGVWVWNEPAR